MAQHTICSVYGCRSTPKYNRDLRFHRFPRDARTQFWIEASRRPDLKDKPIAQLYNMYLCSLHFPEWMYMKTKLKSAAIPILNLPPASLHSMSTQTDDPSTNIIEDLHSTVPQNQIDVTTVDVSDVASTSSATLQTSNKLTDVIEERKRKLDTEEFNSSAKKLNVMEDFVSNEATLQQFLQGCDNYLSPNLSEIVKAQANLKHNSRIFVTKHTTF